MQLKEPPFVPDTFNFPRCTPFHFATGRYPIQLPPADTAGLRGEPAGLPFDLGGA